MWSLLCGETSFDPPRRCSPLKWRSYSLLLWRRSVSFGVGVNYGGYRDAQAPPRHRVVDTIAEQGGDPSKINPVVPTQLIVDHSLAVEHPGFEENAFEKNRAAADRRNEDRFHFIQWTQPSLDNVAVITPGPGITHQTNL